MLAAVAPLVLGAFAANVLTRSMIYATLAVTVDLLWGFTGILTFGQAAFFGVGAYFVALTMTKYQLDVPYAVRLLLAGIVAGFVCLLLGGPLMRTRGHYFAIGTWVVAEVFRLLAAQTASLGGGSGTSLPVSVVLSIASSRTMREFVIYWIALAPVPTTATRLPRRS